MKIFVLLFAICFGLNAFAVNWQKGFVKVGSTQRLYVEHRPAKEGKPTIYFLNGLTWSTQDWQPLVAALDVIDPGIGIVLYDMEGMGKTLLNKAPVSFDIPYSHQVRDLKNLKKKLKVRGESILAGLSYGGAIALAFASQFPGEFSQIVVMAPLLERLKDQDTYIKGLVRAHRLNFPFDLRGDNELYDHYLRIFIYTTYHLAEPSILENPFKQEAIYRMVKGIKDWQAWEHLTGFPPQSVHVLGAAEDAYIKDRALQKYWDSLPESSRASYLRIAETGHKIPDERPELTAAWLYYILAKHPDLQRGLFFEGDPKKLIARSGKISLPLKQKARVGCGSYL